MQCWDSKLVYTYYRLTADNRLFLGGGTPVTTFLKDAYNNNVLGDANDCYKKYFNYFSNHRSFALPSSLGSIIGKPLLFSLANTWAKFYQVDTLRSHDETTKEF